MNLLQGNVDLKIASSLRFPEEFYVNSSKDVAVNKRLQDLIKSDVYQPGHTIDAETINKIAKFELYGLNYNEEYGGDGCSLLEFLKFCEKIGYYDLSLGVNIIAHQSVGFRVSI